MKIYTGCESKSPSRTIFFNFQLQILLKRENKIVKDIKNSDLIIIPYSETEINKILKKEIYSLILKNNISIIIIKPHIEKDIRLNFKTNIGILKSLINRLIIKKNI